VAEERTRLLPSDESLVAEALRGSEAGKRAFGDLIGRYKGMVMGRTHSVVGDWHEAEDLAQEAFLRAYRSLGQLKKPAEFAAWLGTIARNVALTARSRSAQAPEVLPIDEARETPAGASSGQPMSRRTPAEAASRGELGRLVLREVEMLPEEYRSTVYLRYLKGMSCREIAGALGVSVGVVTSRLSRAAATLRERLGKLLATEGGE